MNYTTKTNPLAPATGSLPRRPGAGWKQISGPVWEHTSGLRVHVLGMAMLPDGENQAKGGKARWRGMAKGQRRKGASAAARARWARRQNRELSHGGTNE